MLGRATGSSIAPAVALGNVLSGMGMLALFSWVMFDAHRPAAAASGAHGIARPLAAVALILLAAQISLGVMTSAQLAGRACPEFPACAAASPPVAASLTVFNPFHVLAADDDTGRATLQLAHRAGAALTAVALLVLAGVSWRAHRGNRAPALGLCLLVAVEAALGAALVALDLPLAGVVAHNAVAALLVLAAVTTLERIRDMPRLSKDVPEIVTKALQ